LLSTFCLVKLVYFVIQAATSRSGKQSTPTLTKILFKISANISVCKFWNIGIGDQLNIGNWPNIGEKKLKIWVSVSKNDIGRKGATRGGGAKVAEAPPPFSQVKVEKKDKKL